MRRSTVIVAVLAAVAVPVLLLGSCAATYPDRDPTGERFPVVSGNSLDGRTMSLPDDLPPGPVVLFAGYKQMSQFDIDRWLLGMDQIGLAVGVMELPTIPGLVPGLFANQIDEGMRSGIPSTDWPVVVTVYDDADAVTRFTGNTNGLPARVMLLDGERVVRFFWDQGYSTTAVKRLADAVDSLRVDSP